MINKNLSVSRRVISEIQSSRFLVMRKKLGSNPCLCYEYLGIIPCLDFGRVYKTKNSELCILLITLLLTWFIIGNALPRRCER